MKCVYVFMGYYYYYYYYSRKQNLRLTEVTICDVGKETCVQFIPYVNN
jgi:hypothetical protein